METIKVKCPQCGQENEVKPKIKMISETQIELNLDCDNCGCEWSQFFKITPISDIKIF